MSSTDSLTYGFAIFIPMKWQKCLCPLIFPLIFLWVLGGCAGSSPIEPNENPTANVSSTASTVGMPNGGGDGSGQGNNQEEALRAFSASLVSFSDPVSGYRSVDMAHLLDGTEPVNNDRKMPVIIWLHGCSGIWSGTRERIDWLASEGFAVIAPSSPARTFYPLSCNPETFESGLYRGTLELRQEDVGFALSRLADFPWVDTTNVFVMGFSEGAAVAATFEEDFSQPIRIKARLLEAWTCHSGWREYAGLAATSETVFSLLAANDPWYTAPWHRGDCGSFMRVDNGSESLVFDDNLLGSSHSLLDQPAIRELVRNFLLLQLQSN